MRSRWFARARALDGGLWLPGRPARHAADLLLRPHDVVVSFREQQAVLSWPEGEARPWRIAACFWTRYGARGVALAVDRPMPAGGAEVVAGARTLRNQFLGLSGGPAPLVPLHAPAVRLPPDAAERATLDALCELLARRPGARQRLGDPDRVTALVQRLATASRPERPLPTGTGRRSFEVHNAVRMAHVFGGVGGRPFPGDAEPPVDEIVDRVRRRLAANPFTADLHLDDAFVRRLVVRRYLGVRPWPFEPLLRD